MEIFRRLRHLVFGTVCAAVGSTQVGMGLELSDLALPIDRDRADDILTKDYMYKLLGDGSIRRVWRKKDMTVFVDFSTTTGEVLLIAVEYAKPVSKSVAEADINTIAGEKSDKSARWDPPKNEEGRKIIREIYGLENAMRKKLKDGYLAFYETDKKRRKVQRISVFSTKPDTNRWVLPTLTQDARRTAMGMALTAHQIEDIYNDEKRRQAAPPKTDPDARLASDRHSSRSGYQGKNYVGTTAAGMGSTVNERGTAAGVSPGRRSKTSSSFGRSGVTALGVTAGSGGSTRRSLPRDVGSLSGGTAQPNADIQKTAEDADEDEGGAACFPGKPPAWLSGLGVKDPQWWHYIVLGFAVLIVVLIAFNAISGALRRSAQRAAYKKVVAQSGTDRRRRNRAQRGNAGEEDTEDE